MNDHVNVNLMFEQYDFGDDNTRIFVRFKKRHRKEKRFITTCPCLINEH